MVLVVSNTHDIGIPYDVWSGLCMCLLRVIKYVGNGFVCFSITCFYILDKNHMIAHSALKNSSPKGAWHCTMKMCTPMLINHLCIHLYFAQLNWSGCNDFIWTRSHSRYLFVNSTLYRLVCYCYMDRHWYSFLFQFKSTVLPSVLRIIAFLYY